MNKKTFFLLGLMCLSTINLSESIFAHKIEAENNRKTTYLPVLEEDKVWIYKSYYVRDPCMEIDNPYFGVKVDGKTNIDGREVFVLRSTDPDNPYVSWAYEEDGVMLYNSENEDKVLSVIDFNLDIGDLVFGDYRIIGKEYVEIEGVERCLITMVNGGLKYFWCEGIGAIDDCFLEPMQIPIGEKIRMTECWIGDKCIFNEHSLDAFAEANAIEGVDGESIADSQHTTSPMFDVLGRRIKEPLPGQLYIQGGRKHIGN